MIAFQEVIIQRYPLYRMKSRSKWTSFMVMQISNEIKWTR